MKTYKILFVAVFAAVLIANCSWGNNPTNDGERADKSSADNNNSAEGDAVADINNPADGDASADVENSAEGDASGGISNPANGDASEDINNPDEGSADFTAPSVIVRVPDHAETKVAINSKLSVTFSEAMDPTTITTEEFLVSGPDSLSVSGMVVVDSTNQSAIFTPDSNFEICDNYTVTITTGVQDLAGNALANNASWYFTTGKEEAQTVVQEPVALGSSANFAILASAAITNIPTSKITGDVGLIPDAGSNISGFSDPETCPEITGTMYMVDARGPACAVINPTLLEDAKKDAESAFISARAAVRGTPQAISGNLNGLTLYPGLYESGSSLEISPGGFLYLDAQGDGNAIFIIRSETSITTEATSEVVLTKGAKAGNVYWTAGSAVTLGTNSIMKGTIIAGTSISLLTGANLEGRALNQGASAEAITLDSCTITVPENGQE